MRNGRSLRAQLLASAVAISAFTAPMAAQAADTKFNIAPQSLETALADFSRQSMMPVLTTPDITGAKQTAGVVGDVDAPTALAMLLQGTGLSFRREGDAFLIVRASDPQSGSAAGDGADQGTVQALIVTAQKREENIQDVPIAISAFTQEDLTKSQVAGGPDLMTQVPNFTFTKTNFTGYSIQIRGIGTQAISATTDAAVAVAFNNTPFIRNRFFEQEFYDLQRVEVLRGPQGTLYGRNATAGVVNIISQKPKFTYEAKLSLDVSNYNSHRLEGMVNLPLVDDKVALRIAGAWTKRDGFDTNQLTGNQIDGRDLWSTRLSLRLEPTDFLHANLIWEHFQEDDDRIRSGKQLCHDDIVRNVTAVMPGGQVLSFPTDMTSPLPTGTITQTWAGIQGTFSQGCSAASLYSPDSFQTPNGLALPYVYPLKSLGIPILGGLVTYIDPYASTQQSGDLRVIESTYDPRYKAETDVVELQFNYDLTDHLTLTSETGYSSDTLFSTQDYNRFNTTSGIFANTSDIREGVLTPGPNGGGIFCDPQIGCADRLVAVDLSTADSHHFSQEFRLGSNYEGPFNFSLGANFLRYDTEDKYYVFINTLSMYAANSPYAAVVGIGTHRGSLPPYQAGVTDNHECMKLGFIPPDPTVIQSVGGCEYMDPNPIGSLNDRGHNYFLSKNPYKLISYAVFGEAYYNITGNLKVTAGLRWTVDKKEAPRIPSWVIGADTVGYPVAEVVRQEWREPTGRLTLDWKPDLSFTDETLIYGSFAHGYKAGGMNPPASGIVCYLCGTDPGLAEDLLAATHPKTFKPEFVNAFEVGSKNTLLDGKLTVNGDAFYYDYTGYQISQIVNRAAVNYNFDARIWGLELETDWRPVENLRLGLKLGYENTRVNNGQGAVDVMDRTAGHPGWSVVRPFPTFPSNCIVPTWLFVGYPYGGSTQGLVDIGLRGTGGLGPCELAYVLGVDPVTGLQYTLNPTQLSPSATQPRVYGNSLDWRPGYPGWDPSTAPNHGAGFTKDISGNELPNAPHITATITGDYTIPLPNSWLATLHTDLYYQSEAWTRIFNTPGYDKLKAYTNVNLAAIFSNEDLGWKIMAYVKNVMDRDSITGAFLNSDDSGLTTNVFLTEPRLYGLRVTKEFTGGPWWTGANPSHTGPYPLTIELGGQIQHQKAAYEDIQAPSLSNLPNDLGDISGMQNRKLDWGDGRSVRVTYRPEGAVWNVSAGVRFGRTNNDTAPQRREYYIHEKVCPFTGYLASFICVPSFPYYSTVAFYGQTNWSDASVKSRESHMIVDFKVGRDFGLGSGVSRSEIGLGLRYGEFTSRTMLNALGLALDVRDGWFKYGFDSYNDSVNLTAEREFKGLGPQLNWDAGAKLLGSENAGHLNLDWSLTGGILFGRQKSDLSGLESVTHNRGYPVGLQAPPWPFPQVGSPALTEHATSRGKSATVPFVDLSLGLSYEVQRVRVGAGYRWQRYSNVLDAGYADQKSYDRTIDGPYFKIAVGFGG